MPAYPTKRAALLLWLLAATAFSHADTHGTTPYWSLKTNLLYDATLTPNLGLELRSGSHTSVQLFYGLTPWNGYHGQKKLRHWSLMPEWRRWTGDTPMRGWFYGVHAVGGEMNMGG